jgi:hypothetical protein
MMPPTDRLPAGSVTRMVYGSSLWVLPSSVVSVSPGWGRRVFTWIGPSGAYSSARRRSTS